MGQLWMRASVLVLLSGARMAAAQEATPGAAGSNRQLAGHVFTTTREVQAPFSATAFGTTTVAGTGNANGPRYDLQGDVTGTASYDIAGFGEGFDFSARLTPELSLRTDVFAGLYAGINGRSVLVAGATAQMAAGLGATLAWNLDPRLRAGITFDARLVPDFSLLIANAIVQAIQDRQVDSDDLFQTAHRLQLEPGVSVAWALSRALGVVGQASLLWSNRVSGVTPDKTMTGLSLGVSADFDLNPISPVPIALLGLFHWQGGGGLPYLREYGGGVFYSGRPDVQLGLELLRRESPLHPGIQRLDLAATLANVVLRYYW